MAVEDRSLSEFPRALQVAEQALVMISNPDGLGGYDTNGAVLTEVGKALLNVQYTQQLGNVSVFDAIKNCRVLSGTTTPLANEGANGQLYVKYQTVSNVDTVIGMYFKKDGEWLEISLGGGGGSSYVELTQAEYDAMEQAGTLDPTVMYFITDGQSGGGANIYPDAIAEEYDSTQTYTAGDYVMYGGKLYRCNHIGATGTWEPTWWDETSATDYTKSVNTALTTQINNIHDDTADAYSASSTYAVGDLCIAFGRLYRCTTAIATPEAWNSSHWAATTIADEIALKQNATDNNLTTTNKQIVPAINEVRNYNNLINKPTIPTVNVDRVFTSWGTSLNVPFFRQHYFIFVGNNVFNLWIAGASLNDMNLTLINTNTTTSGQETVTNGVLTCKRTTSGISITLTTNYTVTVIG